MSTLSVMFEEKQTPQEKLIKACKLQLEIESELEKVGWCSKLPFHGLPPLISNLGFEWTEMRVKKPELGGEIAEKCWWTPLANTKFEQ